MKSVFTDFESQYKHQSANDYYCMHCVKLKTTNSTCCGEIDFIKFKEFDNITQKHVIEFEYDLATRKQA